MRFRIGRRTIRRRRKSLGQSMVEFTIMLPVVLILLSGVIEFGFMLNAYLDLIDAAREAARFAANDDPTIGIPTDDYLAQTNFWHRGWMNARGSLATASDGRINWTPTNPTDCSNVNGDIVVSAFSIQRDTVVKRFPDNAAYIPEGASNCGNYQSKFNYEPAPSANNVIYENPLINNNSGAVLIEIYYEYEMVLGLPWVTAFVPDPVVLYAYSFFPNTYAEPTPTP